MRRDGEPLFPELKSLDFLMERRKLYTEGSWQALYQQTPIIHRRRNISDREDHDIADL